MRESTMGPRRRGPQAKPCRTCGDLHPVGRLLFGQCPDCAGLIGLPLRGADGRFITTRSVSFSATGTNGDARTGGAR